MNKKLNRKGFTIVELVIVIAVIAILAAVLIPTFSGVVDKANSSAALQTARSTLTNALNMSSTASLAGKTTTGSYRTVFVVDGYAFGYNGNALEAVDYPGIKGTAKLNKGASNNETTNNFNAILIASDNLKGTYSALSSVPSDWSTNWKNYYTKDSNNNYVAVTGNNAPTFAASSYYSYSGVIKEDLWKVITDTSDVTNSNSISLVDGTYYLNYTSKTTYDAKVYVNSDFSNKVVVFTTFG